MVIYWSFHQVSYTGWPTFVSWVMWSRSWDSRLVLWPVANSSWCDHVEDVFCGNKSLTSDSSDLKKDTLSLGFPPQSCHTRTIKLAICCVKSKRNKSMAIWCTRYQSCHNWITTALAECHQWPSKIPIKIILHFISPNCFKMLKPLKQWLSWHRERVQTWFRPLFSPRSVKNECWHCFLWISSIQFLPSWCF